MVTTHPITYWLLVAMLALGAGTLSGCIDGPFYHLKKANPYFQSQWKKDRELGPVFSDRLQELELLKKQLPTMASSEQVPWAQQLSGIIQKDPSSEMRAQAVAAIALIQADTAVTALNFASGDDVEKVRLAACRAWKMRGDIPARDMLLSLAQTDESSSVRQAAIDGLSVFPQDPEVKSALASLLNDRSPAIQFHVAQSLKTITGRDYQGDFEAWKRFMGGEDVPQPTPLSTAEKVWNSLPSWR